MSSRNTQPEFQSHTRPIMRPGTIIGSPDFDPTRESGPIANNGRDRVKEALVSSETMNMLADKITSREPSKDGRIELVEADMDALAMHDLIAKKLDPKKDFVNAAKVRFVLAKTTQAYEVQLPDGMQGTLYVSGDKKQMILDPKY